MIGRLIDGIPRRTLYRLTKRHGIAPRSIDRDE